MGVLEKNNVQPLPDPHRHESNKHMRPHSTTEAPDTKGWWVNGSSEAHDPICPWASSGHMAWAHCCRTGARAIVHRLRRVCEEFGKGEFGQHCHYILGFACGFTRLRHSETPKHKRTFGGEVFVLMCEVEPCTVYKLMRQHTCTIVAIHFLIAGPSCYRCCCAGGRRVGVLTREGSHRYPICKY